MLNPKSHNSLISKLEWRYATQKFDPEKKIDDELWNTIEQTLILTPSSWGLQTWKFVIVTTAKIKEALVPAAYGQKQVKDCSHLIVICRPAKLTTEYIKNFVEYSASVRKIAVSELGRDQEMMLKMHKGMTDEQTADWMSNQCYIALGNLMTAASILEVDTCPMEGFSNVQFDNILGLDKYDCCSVVVCALGYRSVDDNKANLPKIRFPSEQVIIRI